MNDYIVITGASGWVGKTALFELQKILPEDIFKKKVKAYASTQKSISTILYKKNFNIPIYPIDELNNFSLDNKISSIFHCAFITREKINSFGVRKYIDLNKSITDTVFSVCSNQPDLKIVAISSGAASKYSNQNDLTKFIYDDPYGVLKREEEIKFKKFKNSIVLRIYALSGQFMKDPNIFALGNFLKSAINNEAIKINSKYPVIRSYGNAGDICKLAWNWIMNSEYSNFDHPVAAVNIDVNLLDLANKITKMYNLSPVIYDWSDTKKDIYTAEGDDFREILKKYELKAKSLESQIKDTFYGIYYNF